LHRSAQLSAHQRGANRFVESVQPERDVDQPSVEEEGWRVTQAAAVSGAAVFLLPLKVDVVGHLSVEADHVQSDLLRVAGLMACGNDSDRTRHPAGLLGDEWMKGGRAACATA
jgi:hypothetical protein